MPGRHRIIAELPYYRVRPRDWSATLQDMADAGVDIVSFYVPWRLHERQEAADPLFDFEGRCHPQTDVHGFLERVRDSGLKALVKPGPFIHAEVQFGGLPDRIVLDTAIARHKGWAGDTLPSQGKALPSAFDPVFREQTERWLRVLSTAVLQRFVDNGTIVALQLGNEGVLGELCHPVALTDVSAPALPFLQDLCGISLDVLGTRLPLGPGSWSHDLRAAFMRWASDATMLGWAWLSDRLPSGPERVVNIPLSNADPTTLHGWLIRCPRFVAGPYRIGHTEWIGNASWCPDVFTSHCLQIPLLNSDAAETNWGFTWTDESFAAGGAPAFHSLLAVMLGSDTVSLYSACEGRAWSDVIAMDPRGMRRDGQDPALFAPPYCPGAPFRDGAVGTRSPNRISFDRLVSVLDRYGESLRGSLGYSGGAMLRGGGGDEASALGLPSAIGEAALDGIRAHLDGMSVPLTIPGDEVAGLAADLAKTDGGLPGGLVVAAPSGTVRALVRHNRDDQTGWVGAFNPGPTLGRLTVAAQGRVLDIRVRPHAACLIRCAPYPEVVFDTNAEADIPAAVVPA